MIQDIHAELRCNNQSKIINLFSHVTKLLGNINIFDFIIIDKHSRFSNKILKFCFGTENTMTVNIKINNIITFINDDRNKNIFFSRIKAFCLQKLEIQIGLSLQYFLMFKPLCFCASITSFHFSFPLIYKKDAPPY